MASRDRLAFVVAGLTVGLGLTELSLRAWGPERAWRDELVPQQVSELDIHRLSEDPELLYELVPGLDLERMGPYGPYDLSTNTLGFRGPEPRTEGRRIMVLGGSNTFGPGVGDDQTWPAVVEQRLGVEVLNLGVSGYMTRQKVAMARRHLDLEPDLVVLQVYNTGRRFVLHGTTDEAFERWPSLYQEYFAGAGGAPWALVSWRTAVLGWNRANQQTVAEWLYPGTVEADLAAVQGLKKELDARGVPLVVVLPAAGGSLAGVDLPTIDLSALDPPDTEIHPDAEGHRWAGDRVAASLAPLVLQPGRVCPWTPEQLREAVAPGEYAGVEVVATDALGATLRVLDTELYESWFALANPEWCQRGELDAQGCIVQSGENDGPRAEPICPPPQPTLWFPAVEAQPRFRF